MDYNHILYRKLNVDELSALKHDFIKFLVVQGIDAYEWDKIKSEAPEKMEKLVVAFSNMVFSDILSRIKFLQKLEDNRLELINTESHEWKMITVSWNALQNPVFQQIPDYSEVEVLINQESTSLYVGKRKIERPPDQELFLYLEKNYKPSDGVLYTKLSEYLSE